VVSAFLHLQQNGTRTHLYANVRWTFADTSANTGGYLYFSSSLKKKKNANRVPSSVLPPYGSIAAIAPKGFFFMIEICIYL